MLPVTSEESDETKTKMLGTNALDWLGIPHAFFDLDREGRCQNITVENQELAKNCTNYDELPHTHFTKAKPRANAYETNAFPTSGKE